MTDRFQPQYDRNTGRPIGPVEQEALRNIGRPARIEALLIEIRDLLKERKG